MAKYELTVTGTFECEDDDAADHVVRTVSNALEKMGIEIEDIDHEELDYDLPDEDVVKMFEEDILPSVIAQYGKNDETAQREAFNNYTDMLCKDGQITDWQYENMDNPY
jgi:hypothetical protein